MNKMSAVAIFPSISPENLDEFKNLLSQMLPVIQEQESILRYDVFFNENQTRCVVLEEFSDPSGTIEHVNKNREILDKLVALGGAVDGSIFPLSQEGEALAEIRTGWNTKIHTHFAGKS